MILKGTMRLPQIITLYTDAVLDSGIQILPGLTADLSRPASLIAGGLMIVLAAPMALTMNFLSTSIRSSGSDGDSIIVMVAPGVD